MDDSIGREPAVHDLMYREQEVVRSLREVAGQNIARHGIDIVHGHASFDDGHTIRVRSLAGGPDELLHADVVLVATGSSPSRRREVPFEDPRVYDSDEILAMPRLPRRMTVVGAGVIGCPSA